MSAIHLYSSDDPGCASEALPCTVVAPSTALYWIERSGPEADKDSFGQERRFKHLVSASKVSRSTAIKFQKDDSSRYSPLERGINAVPISPIRSVIGSSVTENE